MKKSICTLLAFLLLTLGIRGVATISLAQADRDPLAAKVDQLFAGNVS